jgi:hypothetical protein
MFWGLPSTASLCRAPASHKEGNFIIILAYKK